MTAADTQPAVVVCGEVAFSCVCGEPAGHEDDSPHVCPCGGSWTGRTSDDTFSVVTLPPGVPVGPALGGVL